MELKLFREDLEDEYKNVNCSQTKFYMFHQDVQQAIYAVGERAVFWEYDGSSYNAIFPTMK